MESGFEIDSADVIKLMLQFLKENNFTESWKTLSKESDVCMNTLDNVDIFIHDIQSGKWDNVLAQINFLKLPVEKLYVIYEQVIFELLELSERDLAKELLKETEPMKSLKIHQPERYLKLEHLCKRPFFNLTDIYEPGTSKDIKRQEIVDLILPEIAIVPPSRLLSLLNHALRYQLSQGMLPKNVVNESTGVSTGGAKYDLFKGARKAPKTDINEKLIKKLAGKIKFSVSSHPETAFFALDGQSLITGSVDGFIEVWDCDSCKIRKDLDYQEREEFMLHENNEAILCSSLSKDMDIFATGSDKGIVKVWKFSTGTCIRKFDNAHSQGITSLCFNRDGSKLLTTSFDCTARIHGMKSGKMLKEFRGHSSYINTGIFTKDGDHILTGSSDSHVKMWDVKTSECLVTFRPGASFAKAGLETGAEITVHTIQLLPSSLFHQSQTHTLDTSAGSSSSSITEHIFICCKSPYAYIATTNGRIIRTLYSGKSTGGDFLCATVSPKGNWVYCVGEDGILYMFDTLTGTLESTLNLIEDSNTVSNSTNSSREVIGISHHPHRNLLVSITSEGLLKLWRA